MKAFAPGKLLLSGSYAVLHGAKAIVLAVSRGAVADASIAPEHVSDEVRAALELENKPFPHVSVNALFEGKNKLGLGASAAGLVAALGVRALEQGEDLGAADVRRRIFDHARAAHSKVQRGGSGVDIAASVYGGSLSYELHEGNASIAPAEFPDSLVVEAYFSGTSASTSSMRARVDAFAANDPRAFALVMRPLIDASNGAAKAFSLGKTSLFIDALHASFAALAELGRASDAPIVLPSFAELEREATGEGAAFIGSGAGGGDVAIFAGQRASSLAFRDRANALGLHAFSFERDTLGLRNIGS